MNSNRLVDKILRENITKLALIGESGSGKSRQIRDAFKLNSDDLFHIFGKSENSKQDDNIKTISNIFDEIFNQRMDLNMKLRFDIKFCFKKLPTNSIGELKIMYKSVHTIWNTAYNNEGESVLNASNFDDLVRFSIFLCAIRHNSDLKFGDFSHHFVQMVNANTKVKLNIFEELLEKFDSLIDSLDFDKYIESMIEINRSMVDGVPAVDSNIQIDLVNKTNEDLENMASQTNPAFFSINHEHEDVDNRSNIINPNNVDFLTPISEEELKETIVDKMEQKFVIELSKILDKNFANLGHGNSWIVFNELLILMAKLSNLFLSKILNLNIGLTLFIDEPESGLHDELQKQFGLFLQKQTKSSDIIPPTSDIIPPTSDIIPPTSVFISTHSPTILTSYINNLNEIAFCSGETNNWNNKYFNKSDWTKFAKEMEQSLTNNWNFSQITKTTIRNGFEHIFKSDLFELRKNILECFFYKNIIICEGSNDYQLILLYTNGNENIKILSALGKTNVISVILVLNSFGIKSYNMFDQDTNQNAINTAVLEKFKTTIINKQDLEKDLYKIGKNIGVMMPQSSKDNNDLKSYVQRHLEYLLEMKKNTKYIFINNEKGYQVETNEFDTFDSITSVNNFIKVVQKYFEMKISKTWIGLQLSNFSKTTSDPYFEFKMTSEK